ncbi:DUF3313 domain-containing protein [Pseudomonas akapageensis]|uniref:DUF3313 domain-containing protein n=1 Tax=Pseudomonas akapageensis TaxID=2609961 RepID=UPI00140A3D8F|nr:DUF3313 domain-containing protein [Pseudomonas akapageensis]
MNMSRKLLVGIAISGLLLAGCTSKVTEKEQYSGFLPSYDGLKEETSPSGKPTLRWMAPGFAPDSYNTVVFNKLEMYPAPKPNERVNVQTLQQLQAYTSDSVRGALAEKYQVVSSEKAIPAGARAMTLRAAITGVSASNEGMKWYEVVPIAAVVGATQAATGHRDQDTELYVEGYINDTKTGQPLVKVVRKLFGKTLENESQQVTANDFKAAINEMTNDLRTMIK